MESLVVYPEYGCAYILLLLASLTSKYSSVIHHNSSLFDIFFHYHFQKMVDEEELQFHEEYMNEKDPSILHFLLASGDDVC